MKVFVDDDRIVIGEKNNVSLTGIKLQTVDFKSKMTSVHLLWVVAHRTLVPLTQLAPCGFEYGLHLFLAFVTTMYCTN